MARDRVETVEKRVDLFRKRAPRRVLLSSFAHAAPRPVFAPPTLDGFDVRLLTTRAARGTFPGGRC